MKRSHPLNSSKSIPKEFQGFLNPTAVHQNFKPRKISLYIGLMALVLLSVTLPTRLSAQCQAGANVPMYNVNIDVAPGGYVIGSYNLGDECCPIQGQNSCLILNVVVGTQFEGVGLCFSPPCSVVGYLFSESDNDFCSPPLGGGIDVCQAVICDPPTGDTIRIMLCKPGAANQPLALTVYGVAAPDLTVTDVTEGCSTTFNVEGAYEYTCNNGSSPPNAVPLPLTWTTDTPGALAYLSCTDCANPTFMYTGPPVSDCNGLTIGYTVSIPATECFPAVSVTKMVTVYPDISGAVTTECELDGSVTLTFVPDLPCPDLVYEWTDENAMVVGTMSSINVPANGDQYCVDVSRTDAPLCSPFDSCALALCCTLEVGCPPANGGAFGCVDDIPAANPDLITVIDSCGPVTITSSDVVTGTGCMMDSMTVVRTYLISDGTDTDTCIQTFKAADNTAPVITCPTVVTPIECPATPTFSDATATDACDDTPTITFTDVTTPSGICPQEYSVTRTWTATDDCGNSSTCSRTISVTDNTPPVITCPTVVSPIECPATPTFPAATAIDACDATPTITFADVTTPSGICSQEYSVTRTWTASDDCGNSSTCSRTIVVTDNTPPVLTCPTVVSPIECPATPTFPAATATDDCDATPTITFADVTTPSGICPQEYSVTRTWTATDDCGNSSTCSRTISVIDNTPPVITCPTVVTPIECPATPTFPAATATDVCDATPTITFTDVTTPSGICPQEYSVTRIWTATDDCGNSATCSRTISVTDNTPPVITCPTVVTPIECPATPTFPAATATDVCDATVTITFADVTTPSGICPQEYSVTRTWTATDDCGNSATCSRTISVTDNTPPVITCPTVVTPIECPTTPTFPAATATDACDATPTITFTDVTTPSGICPQEYSVTRTWTATDDCGNSATCSRTISVTDNTPPVITCPTVVTPIECPAMPTFPAATATDACDATPTITFADVTTPSGICLQEYSVTRTWTATDDCGNSSTCSRTISVTDNTPPVITCPEVEPSVECPAVPVFPPATAIDACDATPTITFTDVTTPSGICPQEYSVTRTWTATDDCGNSSTCSRTISVTDNTAPVLTCPTVVASIECPAVPVFPPATAVDACDATPTITFADVTTPSGICPQEYSVTRTWTATDDCGNSSTCSRTISVTDNTPPVITCPVVVTPIECPATPTFPPATAVDACDATPTITFTDVTTPSGICPQEYSVTRTWTATDDCGNSSTCSRTISVTDNTPPVITCPTVVTPIECPAMPTFPPATATDACDASPTITFADVTTPSGICPQEYSVTRTWTATDDCGNSSTCSRTISVTDNTPPVITCPTVVTPIECPAMPTFPPATATDACDATPTITFADVTTPSGICPQEYSVTRTWTATDDCGNSATCSRTISVTDNTPPVITCPTVVTPIECPAVPVFPPATAVDACDATPTITFADVTTPSGICPQEYSVTRTWTATDDCGNSSTCSRTISVTDNTPPVITCPTVVTPIECPLVPVFPPATAIDACDATPTITFADVTTPSGICPQEYSVTRTWTATDDCGNSSTCSRTISVTDNTPPVITCPTVVTPVECPAMPVFPPATAVDACDATPTITFADVTTPSGICPQEYSVTRTWTATDDCGNSSTCSRTIAVTDNTPPLITCPMNVTVQCASQVPASNTELVLTVDACGGPVTVTHVGDVTTNMTCVNRFTVTRTYRATDECGNSATCNQTITVFDDTVPAITCPANVTVQCATDVPAVNTGAVVATDNCGGTPTVTHVGDVVSNMTCTNRFVVTRTYRATDECGNSATCNQTITVFDNTAPTITCPANVTVQCAALVPAVNTGAVISGDNCGGGAPTITHVGDVISNMTCTNRFIVTRTYRATDVCGNSATCAQTITVFDNTAPTLTCPANVTVQCASQVPAVNTGSVVASDNCAGAVTVTHVGDVITNMTCVNRFTLTRTYRATDVCGNSATCAQTITVFDNTPPTITCPANVTVQCANQVPPVNTASVITSDNCGGTPTVTHVGDVITNMTCINRFTLTRTYRSTDACGNSATCAQVITVFDNTPPVITFDDPLLEGVQNGGTVEVQCFGQDPEWELPTFDNGSVAVTDNCEGTVTVTFTDVLVDEGDCDVDGYINRYRLTWVATDACGNSSSAFVFLELVDLIPPVIHNVPEDITVNCDEIPAPPTDIMATDECLCACIILFDESDPAPGCQDGQIVTRTWTAEDDCGNITVEVQNITLIDNEGPEMIMMVPELAGAQDGDIFEYTCNEGGIPAFFDDLNAESVNSLPSCGTAGLITFNDEIHVANNCKFWGYVENRIYTWDAIDQCGNTTSMSIIARLIDTEDPQIVGVPDTSCIGDPELELIEATDNCDNVSLSFFDVEIPNPCGDGNAIRRTYEAMDNCGNLVRDTAILVPNDNSRPVLEFVNPILAELEPGEMLWLDCIGEEDRFTNFSTDDVSVSDDCMGGMSLTYTEQLVEAGNCNDGVLAVLNLIWGATDACGNSSQLVVPVQIMDTTAPNFVNLELDVTIGCGEPWPQVIAEDNCGFAAVTFGVEIIPGDCSYEYDVMRLLTASDPCGNTTVKMQVIHVRSDGPVIEGVIEELCDDLSIPVVTAYDPCADQFVDVTMTEDTLDIPCNEGIVVERVWSAVDACGNVSEARQLITLGDQTPPEIQVPTHSIIRRFEGNLDNLVLLSQEDMMIRLNALDAGSVFVLDDCDQEIDAEFTLDVVYSENCEVDGFFERRTYTWVATDACGNSDAISFVVDIMDDIPPVLMNVPANDIVICDDLPPVAVVIAEDPAQPVTMDFNEVMVTGDSDSEFIVTRTWTATDACGNSAQASQGITWIPSTLIACDIIPPGAVQCNTHGVVISSDLFGGMGEVSYLWEIEGEKCFIQGGQGTPEIIIYVGWSEVEITLIVTDAFGCSSECHFLLNCLDPIGGSIANLPVEITPETGFNPEDANATTLDILKHFNIWPNPANESINLSFDSSIDQDVQISMTNSLGQIVMQEKMNAIKGFNSKKIDVSHLTEGGYQIQLISQKEIRSKTVVLLRNN